MDGHRRIDHRKGIRLRLATYRDIRRARTAIPGRDRHDRREPLQILDATNRRIRQLLGAHQGYRKWHLLYTFRNAPSRNDNILDATDMGPIAGLRILLHWRRTTPLKGETGRP